MQPPKVNRKVAADDLAHDAGKDNADRQDRDTSMPASEGEAADGAKDIADAQEQVVERGLTRLPPG